MEHIETIFSYLVNILPALFVFVVGFVWHTRSTLSTLENGIIEARSKADSAQEELKNLKSEFSGLIQSEKILFQKEREERRSMGGDLWTAFREMSTRQERIETIIEERTRGQQRKR